jgi:hypothetical protein
LTSGTSKRKAVRVTADAQKYESRALLHIGPTLKVVRKADRGLTPISLNIRAGTSTEIRLSITAEAGGSEAQCNVEHLKLQRVYEASKGLIPTQCSQ